MKTQQKLLDDFSDKFMVYENLLQKWYAKVTKKQNFEFVRIFSAKMVRQSNEKAEFLVWRKCTQILLYFLLDFWNIFTYFRIFSFSGFPQKSYDFWYKNNVSFVRIFVFSVFLDFRINITIFCTKKCIFCTNFRHALNSYFFYEYTGSQFSTFFRILGEGSFSLIFMIFVHFFRKYWPIKHTFFPFQNISYFLRIFWLILR